MSRATAIFIGCCLFAGFARVNSLQNRRLRSLHRPTSPPGGWPCNPNTHDGLVCSDGRTGSFGDWGFCGVKGHDGRWAERKYCPAGFYQCGNGFCSEKPSGCKLFPVKYGPEMCQKPSCGEADTVENLACRAGQTVKEWCVANDPGAVNCDNGDFGINGLACNHPTCLKLRPKPTPCEKENSKLLDQIAALMARNRHLSKKVMALEASKGVYEDKIKALVGFVEKLKTALSNIPNLVFPEIPDISIPDIPEIPDISIPDIPEIPDISIPDIPEIPDISIPDIPEIPGISIPDIPWI